MDFAAQPGRCILVFVKSPEMGAVKTRLAAAVGQRHACRLYDRFVRDLLRMLEKAAGDGHCALNVCFHPPASGKAVAAWLGRRYVYLPQRGKDLGERMGNAFRECFAAGHRLALLVGSDLPDLPAGIIHDAFDAMEKHGAVIGPSRDGGYYLIGFRSDCFSPDVFAGIRWGTGDVYEKTMALLRRVRRDVSVLPAWRDVDTPEDLMDLRARHGCDDFMNSATMRYLLAHDLAAAGGKDQ
jgi:hypothetical protein